MELLLFLLAVLVPIWGILDAARKPTEAWAAIRQSRLLWILLMALLTPVFGMGVIVAVVYLVTVRPKLVAAVSL